MTVQYRIVAPNEEAFDRLRNGPSLVSLYGVTVHFIARKRLTIVVSGLADEAREKISALGFAVYPDFRFDLDAPSQGLTDRQKETVLRASSGALLAFVLHHGRYPDSFEEYHEHVETCNFCQRKDREYQESFQFVATHPKKPMYGRQEIGVMERTLRNASPCPTHSRKELFVCGTCLTVVVCRACDQTLCHCTD